MAASPIFTAAQRHESGRNSSVLPVLTSSGNLLAGATTRVAVGFALNPFSVLKARYEVRTLSAFLRHTHFHDACLSFVFL
jgi:solute carrier family 25, member 38